MRLARPTHAAPCKRIPPRRSHAWREASCFCVLFAAFCAAPASAAKKIKDLGPTIQNPTSQEAFPKQPGGVFGKKPNIDQTQPLNLQADQLIYDTENNRVIARGNVEIFYNNFILTANEVVYDQAAKTLTAAGNVVLKDPNGNIVRADRYTLTDDFRDGFVQQLSVVTKDDSKISADRATRRDGNVTEFSNAKFTPCKSDGGMPPLWCLSAARIVHDQQAAVISYEDATFDFFGVPIAYFPYFEHADPTVKRKSGFLLPAVGNSDRFGFFAETPYYYALAQNYDFLFHPRYQSKQGVLWQGDWRHRLEKGQYTIKLAGLDQDAGDLEATDGLLRDDLDGWRGSLETKGEFSLSSWWKLGWDVTLESDDQFRRYYQLDSVLHTDRVNRIDFTGQSERNYFGATLFHFGGLSLDDSFQADSVVHPVVDYNYVFAEPLLGGELAWDTNILSFSRDDILNMGDQQDLNRVVTELKWRRKLTDPLGLAYTPFAHLRGDLYQLSNYVDPETGDIGPDDTLARGLATGGATISYPWIATAASASHVVEPIGQIVTRQESTTQRRLPNEDAKSLVFDDSNLFEADKFSGFDRVETGTRGNVGVQYTIQTNNGGYARFLAGQSYHLGGDNPYEDPGVDGTGLTVFSPNSGLDSDRSDYVLGAYLAPSSFVRLISQTRFDEDNFEVRREDAAAKVTLGPLFAQAIYSYAAGDPAIDIDDSQHEVIGALGLKLTDRWSVGANMRYDLDEEMRLLDSFQVRYGDECFVLTATYNETFIRDDASLIEPDRSILLRFELKHLGEFGYKTDILDHTYGDNQPPQSQQSAP